MIDRDREPLQLRRVRAAEVGGAWVEVRQGFRLCDSESGGIRVRPDGQAQSVCDKEWCVLRRRGTGGRRVGLLRLNQPPDRGDRLLLGGSGLSHRRPVRRQGVRFLLGRVAMRRTLRSASTFRPAGGLRGDIVLNVVSGRPHLLFPFRVARPLRHDG